MKRTLWAVVFSTLLAVPAFAGQQIEVGVNGMVCAFCAQGIQKKFKKEPAVDSVKVSLAEKRVSISLKDGKDITDEKIKKLINDAGYAVEKVERK